MKFKSVLLLAFSGLLMFSCADDLANVGVNIQPQSDEIGIYTDTFYVETETCNVDYIYTRQDSFLLGSFYSSKFGTTQADILAQVGVPLNFKFPAGSIADSALVVLISRSRFGDSYSPVDINIYEMNKNTFSYTAPYPSNLLYTDYTDKSIRLGQSIVTAKDADSTDYTNVRLAFKLTDDFKNRFFTDAYYDSESKFLNFFKGIYITANYGASTLFNISQIDLEYYYHYSYTVKNSVGRDSTVVVNDVVPFPANDEVRQVNRFSHPNKGTIDLANSSYNYVASPANLNTKVNLPLKRMKESMDAKLSSKKRSMNSAVLKVEAADVADSTYAVPTVSYMLLIKEDSIENFFVNKKLPSSTYAILGKLTATQIDSSTEYDYSYSFDCAALIANELKYNQMPGNGKLAMRLIPVEVEMNSSKAVTAVKHAYKMSAVTLRSGKNADSPMKINMVYSGF